MPAKKRGRPQKGPTPSRDPKLSAAQRQRRNLPVTGSGRECTVCNEFKPWDSFFKNAKGANGHQSQCIPCYRAKQAAYRKKNKKHVKRIQRNSMLKANYGIDHDDYDKLLDHTEKGCWICGGGSAVSLAVDHNHANGKVRGLLCKPCNRILGHWRDNPEKAARAAEYVKDDGATVERILNGTET